MTEERTFDPTSLDRLYPGHWQILEHALSGRMSAANLFLVQWPSLADSPERDGEDVNVPTAAVQEAVKSETPCETLCLPFDASTVLVIVGESASDFLDRSAQRLSVSFGRSIGRVPSSGESDGPVYWIAADPDQVSLRFRRYKAGKPARSPAKTRLVLPDADFFFFPVWDTSENHLFAYLCRPFWDVPDRGRLTEATPEVAAISPERMAAIDLTIFETAGEFVRDALDHYRPAQAMIPVHASLFASDEAVAEYFATIDRAIWEIVEQVWFEVICTSEVPGSLVAAAIERLSRYGQPPLIRADANHGVPSEAVPGGVWSVGMEIDPTAPSGERGSVLKAFRSEAAAAGCRSHVIGLATAEETLEAVNAGFDYVGSDALMPPLAAPGSAGFEAQPTDLLRTILASRAK